MPSEEKQQLPPPRQLVRQLGNVGIPRGDLNIPAGNAIPAGVQIIRPLPDQRKPLGFGRSRKISKKSKKSRKVSKASKALKK